MLWLATPSITRSLPPQLLHHCQAEPIVISPKKVGCCDHNRFFVVREFHIGTERVSEMYQFVNNRRFLVATRQSARKIVVLLLQDTDMGRLCRDIPRYVADTRVTDLIGPNSGNRNMPGANRSPSLSR